MMAMVGMVLANPCRGEPADLPLGPRQFSYAGLDWTVHASATPRGAGPNRWSDHTEAVRVESGLVLGLQDRGEGWWGAEVSAPVPARRGKLSFQVDGPPLDSQVVAGVFLYENDTCELDVEFGRWGQPDAMDTQFAVSPATPDLVQRFARSAQPLTYTMEWSRRRVRWTAMDGSKRVATWTVRGRTVPHFQEARLHLNLWSLKGRGPAGDGATEIRVQGLRVR